jgi:hypothetical protein
MPSICEMPSNACSRRSVLLLLAALLITVNSLAVFRRRAVTNFLSHHQHKATGTAASEAITAIRTQLSKLQKGEAVSAISGELAKLEKLLPAARVSAPTSSAKYVVAGLAFGPQYNKYLMRKFVGSLRTTGYNGDVLLGVSPTQDDEVKEEDKVLEYYTKMNVTAKVVDSSGDIDKQMLRYIEYRKWLEPYADDTLVFLCDTKDTFFQQHPFRAYEEMFKTGGKDLFFFQEYIITIGTQAMNRGWILDCWGEAELKKIESSPVLCSGTTMGTKKGVQRYLDVLLGEFDKMKNTKTHGKCCRNAVWTAATVHIPRYKVLIR